MKMEIPPIDVVAETFPSVNWDDQSWLLAFEAKPSMVDAILDSIAGSSRRWHAADEDGRRKMAGSSRVYLDNVVVDETIGVAAPRDPEPKLKPVEKRAMDTLPGAPLSNLRRVPIQQVKPHPRNVRDDLGDLKDLVKSICEMGVLQPLTVAWDEDQRSMTVIAGHRRLEAAKRAGLSEIQVILRTDLVGPAVFQAMLIENLHREKLEPLEEARGFAGLVELGWTQKDIGRKVGRGQPYVAKRLILLDLPPEVQGRVTAKELSATAAVRIAQELKGRAPADVDPKWATPWFSESHRLSQAAREQCATAGHSLRRRIGLVACDECWESVIRRDENNGEFY